MLGRNRNQQREKPSYQKQAMPGPTRRVAGVSKKTLKVYDRVCEYRGARDEFILGS